MHPIVGSNDPKPAPFMQATACFPSQMWLIRTQLHYTVAIKILSYPPSIFFLLDPPLVMCVMCVMYVMRVKHVVCVCADLDACEARDGRGATLLA